MIRIAKGARPQVLEENAERWTTELLELLRSGAPVPKHILERYKHQEVKEAVRLDSREKCIYCESKLLHVTHGDIEHIKPKSKYPQLTYDWLNLGLACTRCNMSKADRYPEDAPPLNPYTDDPEAFLIAVGELIWPQPGNDRGQITEGLLSLNRPDLLVRRRERIETIRRLVDAIARAQTDATRHVLKEQLSNELADDREYLLVCRSVAKILGAYPGAAAAA